MNKNSKKLKTSAPKAEMKLVNIDLIEFDSLQPREYLPEKELNELTESIKSNGVLQPIMIRPIKDSDTFMVVCGERRLRASVAAGLSEIPAVIRHLNDDEALEIQVVENLQRLDIRPFEEAEAIDRLHKKFTVEEIAFKIGKSKKYIATRMQLVNLITNFRVMLDVGKMTIKQAVELAKCTEDVQKNIWEAKITNNFYGKNWDTDSEFMLGDIDSFVSRSLTALKGAPFDVADALLCPEAGSCYDCKHNTANHPLLFPDDEPMCKMASCFELKKQAHYNQRIQEAIQNPEVVVVAGGTDYSMNAKERYNSAVEKGIDVKTKFEVVSEPEPIISWDEYLKEAIRFNLDEDCTEEEKKTFEAHCREEYEDELQEYNEELAAYNELMASGKVTKALAITSHNGARAGEYFNVILNESSESGEAVKSESNAEQIAAIEAREIRAQELDREKIFNRVIPELKEKFLTDAGDDTMLPEERAALCYMLISSDYGYMMDLCRDMGVNTDSVELYKKLVDMPFNEVKSLINKCTRRRIYAMYNKEQTDYFKNAKPAILMEMAKIYIPDLTSIAIDEQNEKAAKRQVNVNARIKALKNG